MKMKINKNMMKIRLIQDQIDSILKNTNHPEDVKQLGKITNREEAIKFLRANGDKVFSTKFIARKFHISLYRIEVRWGGKDDRF